MWLEREGLIAPEPGSQGDWIFVTRRGQQMRHASDLKAYRDTGLLPRKLLHPTLVGKVVAPFVRGEYDTAVFQAFKEVEVTVRAKGRFEDTRQDRDGLMGVPRFEPVEVKDHRQAVTPRGARRVSASALA